MKAAVSAYAFTAAFTANAAVETINNSDSVYLFSYSRPDGKSGLRMAWSEDGEKWESICDPHGGSNPAYDFVSSDFGPWGSHKTMFDPRLYRTADGWMASWYVSDKRETVASAYSHDLMNWEPQRYATREDSCKLGYCGLDCSTPTKITLNGKVLKGEIMKVTADVVKTLSSFVEERGRIKRLEGELMKDDAQRFAGLKSLTADITIDKSKSPLKISDKLIGIFFEDINYAADGGLYAEMVQNRDFEYDYNENHRKGWGPAYAWSMTDCSGNAVAMKFSEENPIHANNPHYLAVTSFSRSLRLFNDGFDGMTVKKGDSYDFSMFVRLPGNQGRKIIKVNVISKNGAIVGSARVKAKGNGWQKVEGRLKVKSDEAGARLQIEIPAFTECDLDMISLFPVDTYKKRKNGLRKDLAQALEDLKPKFVRFPGGCVAHGDGLDNIYDWKGSIGPIESRKPLRNLWNYHQTRGLGYHEYFLFCEDLGAEPLPVLAAGVPCQNSGRPHAHSHNEITTLGQQCGIPMDKMDEYVQDILDLIEYANGSPDTEWGGRRASAGHPEPFNLKYLGIGNEDMITEVFEERFKYIHDIIREKHPEITVIGTVGPFFEGSDYTEGWKFAKEENVAIVDEHYYVSPGWYLNNRDYYDSYDRTGSKVYLGEYASHLQDRKNTLEAALSIALYLTDVERNADVVEMTSYAPLLAKDKHYNWRPDLVFFNNDSIRLTPDYYVQRMYGNNSGNRYVASVTSMSDNSDDVKKRFGTSHVIDEETGDMIVKIANLLPVRVFVSDNLQTYVSGDSEAEVTTLSGNPDDECTKPVNTSVSIKGGKLDFEAEPYSFSVVRIHLR